MRFQVDWAELRAATRTLSGIPAEERVTVFQTEGTHLVVASYSPQVMARVVLESSQELTQENLESLETTLSVSLRLSEGEPTHPSSTSPHSAANGPQGPISPIPSTDSPTPHQFGGRGVLTSLLTGVLNTYSEAGYVIVSLTDELRLDVLSLPETSSSFSDFWLGLHPDSDPIIQSTHLIPLVPVAASIESQLEQGTSGQLQPLDLVELTRVIKTLKPFVSVKKSFSSGSQYRFDTFCYIITDSLGVFTPNRLGWQGIVLEAPVISYLEKTLPTKGVASYQLLSGRLLIQCQGVTTIVTTLPNLTESASYLSGSPSEAGYGLPIPATLLKPVLSRVPSDMVELRFLPEGKGLQIAGNDLGIGASRVSYSQTLPVASPLEGVVEVSTKLLQTIVAQTSDELQLLLTEKGTSWAATFVDDGQGFTVLTQIFKVKFN